VAKEVVGELVVALCACLEKTKGNARVMSEKLSGLRKSNEKVNICQLREKGHIGDFILLGRRGQQVIGRGGLLFSCPRGMGTDAGKVTRDIHGMERRRRHAVSMRKLECCRGSRTV